MKLKAGVEFSGNPDEEVWITPQTVYDSIPDDQPVWKQRFINIVGHSMPPELRTKGEIYGYALNAYAAKYLPQYFYDTITFYQATQTFLIQGDLTAKENPFDDNWRAFFTVSATAIGSKETTNEAEPCYQRYQKEPGHYTYFGYPPYIHKATPYPAPCVQQYTPFEAGQRGPLFNPASNDAFMWRFADGGSSTYFLAGGVTVDVNDIEVMEGGLIYVSLPDLPYGVPEPPPLVGFVVDYGPPGPPGPPGPRGLPGVPGEEQTGEDIVTTLCALPDATKDALKDCLHFPDPTDLLSVVLATEPLVLKEASEIILKTSPELIIPSTEIAITAEGEAALTAVAVGGGGWSLLLTLPIALLIGIKLIMQEIKVLDCDGTEGQGYRSINVPVLSIGDYNQAVLFQELFKQIAWLLRCCPPCELNVWELVTNANGSFSLVSPKPFDALMLKFKEVDGPEINAWYGDTSIHKYGEVRFILEDHIPLGPPSLKKRMTTLEFWNSREQVFECKRGTVIGFQISMEVPKDYEIWIRVRGQFDGPFSL